MTSLRQRLTGLSLAVTSAVLGLAGVALWAATTASRGVAFDADLRATAKRVAAALEADGDELRVDSEQTDTGEFARRVRPTLLEVVDEQGRSLYRSPGLAARTLPAPAGGWLPDQVVSLRLADGTRAHGVAVSAVPRAEEDDPRPWPSDRRVAVHLVRATHDLEQAARELAAWLALIGLLAVATLAAALRWSVAVGLRPVDALAEAIGGLGDQPGAVVLESTPAELAPVVEQLNSLLARLDEALARERAFAASAAHELRTPLAGLRATIEVTLARERASSDYVHALTEALTATVGMSGLVEDLLMLARLDAGRQTQQAAPTRPSEQLAQAWAPLASRAHAVGQTLTVHDPAALVVRCDSGLLGRIVANLLDNAVCHGEAGEVAAAVEPRPRGWRLTVRSPGCDLSPEQASHAAERFWRGDAARSAVGDHSGLGLSLVESAAQALGGELSIVARPGEYFEVRIDFAAEELES